MSLKDEIRALVDEEKAEIKEREEILRKRRERGRSHQKKLLTELAFINPFLREIVQAGGQTFIHQGGGYDACAEITVGEEKWVIHSPSYWMSKGKWRVHEARYGDSSQRLFKNVESLFENLAPDIAASIAREETQQRKG